MEEIRKIKDFKDLYAWQEAHTLVLLIYKETKSFPLDERFALTDQLRRAATSIGSNIAEGFCRKTSPDKIRFYSMSLGSNAEIQNQITIAKDLNYINDNDYRVLYEQSITVGKLCHGLIKGLEKN